MEEHFLRPGSITAAVHISGFRTGINVNYLPNGLEIKGFHDRIPPYIRLESDGVSDQVYVDEGDPEPLNPETEIELAKEYYEYFTWDPRRIDHAGLIDEERLHRKTVWQAKYDMQKIRPKIHEEILEQYKVNDSYLRPIEYVTSKPVGDVPSRLRQLRMWEPSPQPTLITLEFRYNIR